MGTAKPRAGNKIEGGAEIGVATGVTSREQPDTQNPRARLPSAAAVPKPRHGGNERPEEVALLPVSDHHNVIISSHVFVQVTLGKKMVT